MPQTDDRLTLGRYLADWLSGTVERRVRPTTYTSYRMIVERHLTPGLGRITLARLTTAQVGKYLAAKIDVGLSPRTVQYHHAVLRTALEDATREGLVSRNIAKLVSPPSVQRAEVRPLSAEQAQQLHHAVEGGQLEPLYALALTLALRQGELLALRWEDLDLETGELRVHATLQRLRGAYSAAPTWRNRSPSARAGNSPSPRRSGNCSAATGPSRWNLDSRPIRSGRATPGA